MDDDFELLLLLVIVMYRGQRLSVCRICALKRAGSFAEYEGGYVPSVGSAGSGRHTPLKNPPTMRFAPTVFSWRLLCERGLKRARKSRYINSCNW